MWHLAGARPQSADHQAVAPRLHHARRIVGGRAVDAEAERRALSLEFAGRTDAGGEHHVRGRAMADADTRASQPRDLFSVEMNAMREPDAARHPTGLLQKIDRPQAIHSKAEPLLVVRLAKVGVKLAIVA